MLTKHIENSYKLKVSNKTVMSQTLGVELELLGTSAGEGGETGEICSWVCFPLKQDTGPLSDHRMSIEVKVKKHEKNDICLGQS